MKKSCVALIAVLVLFGRTNVAFGEYCGRIINTNSGSIEACPQKDGATLAQRNLTVTLQIFEDGVPAAGIPADQFFLIGPLDEGGAASPCPGHGPILSPDGPTDSQGIATFSGAFQASTCCIDINCYTHLFVYFNMGMDPILIDCDTDYPVLVPIRLRSVDFNKDYVVTLADLSQFAQYYPPGPYNDCVDFDGNGAIDLADLSIFSTHYGPPGHRCP